MHKNILEYRRECIRTYCVRKKCVIITGIRVALLEKRQTSIGTDVAHNGYFRGPKKSSKKKNRDSVRLIITPVI